MTQSSLIYSLSLLSAVAGLVVSVGVLYLESVRRDKSKSGANNSVEISPGKLVLSGTPHLIMLAIGCCLAGWPLWLVRQQLQIEQQILIQKQQFDERLTERRALRLVSIKGNLESGHQEVSMIVVAVPHYESVQHNSGPFEQKVPLLSDEDTYRLHFVVRGQIVADQRLDMKGSEFDLGTIRLTSLPQPAAKKVVTRKEGNADDFAHLRGN
jgi:hypothetical protein